MRRVPRARALACLALAALVTANHVASAQSVPPRATARPARVRDALSGEALAAFDRASILFTSRSFGPARAEFERAHDLSGEPRVLYNVAVCDKELGRYARAIASLRQSLTEGGKSLTPGYVGKVNDTIALLAPLVTTLLVASGTAGAGVLVDGEAVGTTPVDGPIPLDVGEHDVLVRKTGFVDFLEHVSAVGGRPVELRVTLEPLVPKGHLAVTASAGPAVTAAPSVIVDGTDVGNAPWEGDLVAGVHSVGARAPGFSAPFRQVELPPGQTTHLAFTLAPDARLQVAVDDADAVVRLDGVVLGRGEFDGPVASGEHEVTVTGGGTPYKAEISLQRGEKRSMSIQLHRGGEVPAWVWIGGGALVVAGAVTAVLYLTATKKFEGSGGGTLNPSLVPTGFKVGAW
jgi:hypothetical protein